MNGAPTFPDWSSVLKRKAQLVHQQIAAMQRLANLTVDTFIDLSS